MIDKYALTSLLLAMMGMDVKDLNNDLPETFNVSLNGLLIEFKTSEHIRVKGVSKKGDARTLSFSGYSVTLTFEGKSIDNPHMSLILFMLGKHQRYIDGDPVLKNTITAENIMKNDSD